MTWIQKVVPTVELRIGDRLRSPTVHGAVAHNSRGLFVTTLECDGSTWTVHIGDPGLYGWTYNDPTGMTPWEIERWQAVSVEEAAREIIQWLL